MLQGEGFDVMKSGDARVALIGFPSVGKVSHQSYQPTVCIVSMCHIVRIMLRQNKQPFIGAELICMYFSQAF